MGRRGRFEGAGTEHQVRARWVCAEAAIRDELVSKDCAANQGQDIFH